MKQFEEVLCEMRRIVPRPSELVDVKIVIALKKFSRDVDEMIEILRMVFE